MMSIAGRSFFSLCRRLITLVRGVGIKRTFGVCISVVEDYYLKVFDRVYRVHTSGIISLSTTSVDPSKARDASEYAPVNAWALRHLFNMLNLDKNLSFVDLGAGLGRACLLAAEYGFARVTGVDVSPEFCQTARNNAAAFGSRVVGSTSINIIQSDVLEYTRITDDDVFFLFKPFTSSSGFLEVVLSNLAERANKLEKTLFIIYTERLIIPSSEVDVFRRNQALLKFFELISMGQIFYVYKCQA